MTVIELARKLRPVIERAAQGLDDATASEAAALFPRLRYDGGAIAAGTRINWGGTVKRAAADLWDVEENAPDAAPALWEDIAYRAGIRIIPASITAGTAFSRGELGWWGDTLYRSVHDGQNVWTPEQYPAGWAPAEESGQAAPAMAGVNTIRLPNGATTNP